MTLHDMIQADASTVFCNVNDFAETATYYASHGSAREINVVIERDPLAVFGPDGDDILPSFAVKVVNSTTLGISSEELNCGGDSLEFASRVGKPVLQRSIMRVIEHDEGMLVLECR